MSDVMESVGGASSVPEWVGVAKELGSTAMVLVFVGTILYKRLIPFWLERSVVKDKAILDQNTFLRDLLREQGDQHASALKEVADGINRLSGLIVAHYEATSGRKCETLLRRAEEISGERYEPRLPNDLAAEG